LDCWDAFARNGDNSISLSEFSSLLRVVAGDTLNKKQIYAVMSMMDERFDRRIEKDEFLNFWLCVFAQYLKFLKTSARNVDNIDVLIEKVQKTMTLTFGSGFEETDVIPGPFSAILRKVGAGDMTLRKSLRNVGVGGRSIDVRRQEDRADFGDPRADAENEILKLLHDKGVRDEGPRGSAMFAARDLKERSRKRPQYGSGELKAMKMSRERKPRRGNARLGVPKRVDMSTKDIPSAEDFL